MICKKNGVVILLTEYGHCVMTDHYELDDIAIFRTTATVLHPGPTLQPTIEVYAIEHWFDQHRDYGVLIATPGNWDYL